MSKLESTRRLLRRWFTSLPFFVLLGLILGWTIAIPVIPRPNIATIAISGVIFGSYTDDVLTALRQARDDNSIKAVVLKIDSPGGEVAATEQMYLDLLRLREKKPVVAIIGSWGASGGYYTAVASSYIYAQPTSQLGSIGAWSGLPSPERVNEETLTTGPFKASGGSKRKAMAELEMVRQEFISAVISQRGDRLKLSSDELSQAELYLGVEALRYGLIDEIGTMTDAIEKAASLASIRNYQTTDLSVAPSFLPFFFMPSDKDTLKSHAGPLPVYYYLYFESE